MKNAKNQDVCIHTINISLFDLGLEPLEMKENWKAIKHKYNTVFLQEFAGIDFLQVLDNTTKDVLDICLEMIMYIQANDKKLAKEKQAIGIQKAREMGVKLGRKPRDIPFDFYDAYTKWKNQKLTVTAITKMFDVNYKTLKKWIAQLERREEMY